MGDLQNEQNENLKNKNIAGGPNTPDSFNDSQSDKERLKEDDATIILPDVEAIPGQEHVHSVAPFGEMGGSTASSDDEEGIVNGKDLLADDNDLVMDSASSVTIEDIKLLDGFREAQVDETDDEGRALNEKNEEDDLDVPGAELDDANEDIGEEDEENNYYSLGDN